MRNEYSTTIPRRKNATLSLVNRCHRSQYQHQRPNISKIMLWDQKGLVYYELLKPDDSITGDRYRLQLIRLSRALREKRPEYEQRHDKVILLHDNARPQSRKKIFGNAQMGYFTAPAVFFGHCSFWLFRRMQQVTDSLLSQKSKIDSKIGSPPKTSHFFEMELEIA